MQTPDDKAKDHLPARRAQQLTLLELMLMIAGIAFGLWLVINDVRRPADKADPPFANWVIGLVGVLMASWLLWPPVSYHRALKGNLEQSSAWVCYFYGTPLMAIYVTAALLAGGWLRRRGRRFRRLSWREQFGLIMNLLWASTGLYVLYLIYREDW